jgi:phosphatidylserine/phosphatidylglycerophosphate/cardiolipin synthase-like enzyme
MSWIKTQAPNVRITVRSAEQLHAKVIWTDRGALISSANLTGSGYTANAELGVRLEAAEAFAQRSIRHVLEKKVRITSESEWKSFLEKSERSPGAISLDDEQCLSGSDMEGTGWQEFVQQLVARGRPHSGIR